MGRKGHVDTIVRILGAFAEERVWSQAALARACGVTTRTIRERIFDLIDADVPLSRDPDGQQVYWVMKGSYFPGGQFVPEAGIKQIARVLQRQPVTPAQQRALVVLGIGGKPDEPSRDAAERTLVALEDAVRLQHVVEVDYHSAHSDEEGRRLLSVHRIYHGTRARIVATCHRTHELKWFRTDRIRRIQPAPAHRMQATTPRELDQFESESLNFYRATGTAKTYRFLVRSPEARWVRANLPVAPFSETAVSEGVRFEIHTAGLETLARYVVGLGAAAWAETPELRRAVQKLARGALAAEPRKRSRSSARKSTK